MPIYQTSTFRSVCVCVLVCGAQIQKSQSKLYDVPNTNMHIYQYTLLSPLLFGFLFSSIRTMLLTLVLPSAAARPRLETGIQICM